MKLLFTRKEAAACLGVSPRTLDTLISFRYFKPKRIGARVQIPVAQLEEFIKHDHPKLEMQD
jgi:excisionase family DNA binding protein